MYFTSEMRNDNVIGPRPSLRPQVTIRNEVKMFAHGWLRSARYRNFGDVPFSAGTHSIDGGGKELMKPRRPTLTRNTCFIRRCLARGRSILAAKRKRTLERI